MGLGDGEGQGHGPGIRTFLLCGMDLCQVGREPPVRLHGLEEHWYPSQSLGMCQTYAPHTHIRPQLLHQRLGLCRHSVVTHVHTGVQMHRCSATTLMLSRADHRKKPIHIFSKDMASFV